MFVDPFPIVFHDSLAHAFVGRALHYTVPNQTTPARPRRYGMGAALRLTALMGAGVRGESIAERYGTNTAIPDTFSLVAFELVYDDGERVI